MGSTFLIVLTIYTVLLLSLGAYSKRKALNAGQFLDGGRKFGILRVCLLMTAMWGASMFSLAIDAGYIHGLSAVWLGISTIIASLFVAGFMLKPFRKIGYLTNSNLIGQKYGTKARDIAALVIGLTFPIFAMKNVLAAASFLHSILGWSLPIVLIATTLLIIVYVSLGGLWSMAYIQILNLAIFTVGLLVAAYYGLRQHAVMTTPVPQVHGFHSFWGIGLDIIAVWFGMSLLNSVSAQAELQTISAAKDVKRGKLGVYFSTIPLLGFAILPVLLGMAAREQGGNFHGGLLAFPYYLQSVAPHWALVVVGLGFWAAALIWCAPLMFSGASSFGLDLFNRQGVSHNTNSVRRFTRLSMIIIVIGTLLENRGQLRITRYTRRFRLGVMLALTGLLFLITSFFLPSLQLKSLLSVDLFLVVLMWFFAVMFITEQGAIEKDIVISSAQTVASLK